MECREAVMAVWLMNIGRFCDEGAEGLVRSCRRVLEAFLDTEKLLGILGKEPEYEKMWKLADTAFRMSLWESEDSGKLARGRNLTSVFSRVTVKDQAGPKKMYYSIRKESPQAVFPQEEGSDEGRKKLSAEFMEELQSLEHHLPKSWEDFIVVFDGLLRKYVWCITASDYEGEDISLYNQSRIAGAVAACMLRSRDQESRYFKLAAGDFSGIQNYVFSVANVSEKGVAKRLRARSFYVDVAVSAIAQDIIYRFGLTQNHILMLTGGKFYLLLPNTVQVCETVEDQEREVNRWFMDTFGISLYVAGGYAPCSAKSLRNEPGGSYCELYRTASRMISGKKAHRYGPEEILHLNEISHKGDRECSICHKMDRIDSEDRCRVCAALEKMSAAILYQDFFTVIREPEDGALPLPGQKYLAADTKQQMIRRMDTEAYVRSYTKNEIYTGKHVTTKLWIGDYTTGDSFDEFASKAGGIERLGVLRADVDNLGHTFVYGFQRPGGDDSYVTLSRTAALSRQLSLFFKGYINRLLAEGDSRELSGGGKRNVTIVYSGGDDVFLVGAWNEVIDAFTDLHKALERFTQGTLTVSGGIGLYPSGYPINIMAGETAKLEDCSKGHDGKNAVTLFDENHTYGWEEFVDDVLGEKLKEIRIFFESSEERGLAFLYRLLELLRNEKEKINTARYVYLLSRMEPGQKSSKEQKDAYRRFAENMYQWRKDPENRRKVITAMYLYTYLTREKEENR